MTHDSNRRSHVLLTLGVLFTLGGATRFLPDNIASAESSAVPASAAVGETSTSPAPTLPGAPTELTEKKATRETPGEVCFTGETAALLSEDQWLFESSEQSLKEEKLALQAWKAELEKQTIDLKAVQAALDARWQEMQLASDSDIKHLAEMYGTMKAEQAASIFNQMDPGFAAGFLRLLPSEQAGLILASMETEKAYVVSVKLATMNDDVRSGAVLASPS